MTIIVVTHDPSIAAYTDRIVTMRDGRVVSDEIVRHERKSAAANTARVTTDRPVGRSRAGLKLGASWAFTLMVLAAAAQAIMRNKLRAVLTMLGVFIGVAALIAMVAVGQGANAAVEKQIESLGTNLVVVLPGATTTNGVRGGHGSASSLTVDDAQAISREAPAVQRDSYMVRQMGQVQYEGQNWTTNVQGVTPEYLPITNWVIASGRDFTEADEQSGALVVVIGNTVAKQIFGSDEDPVGASILVKGFPLRVIGVLAAKGQSGWGQDQDDLVMIPFTTAQNKVLGVATPSQVQTASDPLFPVQPNPFGIQPRLTGKVNAIYVQARGAAFVPAAVEQVTDILHIRHRIQPDGTNDFDVRNLSQIAQAREGSSRIMALLLAAVASISLLVGGIGIMNILLVSVTERTREIGIRMAIGAQRVHVLLQFLTEAVLLSAAGGVGGIIVGIVISQVISHVAEWPTLVSPLAVAGGFWFSAAVGIFFGFYPARKAAISTRSKRCVTSS